MMDVLAQIVVWLNAAANAPGTVAARPHRRAAGLALGHVVAAVTGVLLLVVFKYTSNQRAIKRVRNDINANLLALKLFKDSAAVALAAQGRILWGACRLFVLALVPMLVMAVPVPCSWASSSSGTRPGRCGSARRPCHPEARTATPAIDLARREPRADGRRRGRRPARSACRASARSAGTSRRASTAAIASVPGRRPDGRQGAGDRRRLHAGQPAAARLGLVGDPAEPLGASRSGPTSPVQSIEIDYPERSSWTSGTDSG